MENYHYEIIKIIPKYALILNSMYLKCNYKLAIPLNYRIGIKILLYFVMKSLG